MVQELLAGMCRRSETECVLKLCRYFALLSSKSITGIWILNPPLAEHKEKVIPRSQGPSGTALPAQIPRPVVVLKQIGKRKEGRSRIVHPRGKDPGGEIALRQPGKRLVGVETDSEPGRDLVG